MSKLETLIQQLCPDGVEYKKLGDIAVDVFRGSGIKRDDVTETGTPCVRYGEIYTTYGVWFDTCISHTDASKIASAKYFEYGDILFAITGESVKDIAKCCAYVGHERCLAGGDIVVLRHNQDPKYLSYALSTTDAQQQKSKGKVKSKVVHSSVPAIKELVVPVPPLEIQREIVRILDNFTELTAKLTAELAARKKQYEYYRDALFSIRNCEHVMIKDLATTNIGLATSVTKYKTSRGVLLLHNSDIQQNHIVLKQYEYVSEEFARKNAKKLLQKDDIITVHTGDVGTSAVIGDPYIGAIGFTTITTRISDQSKITPQYLCHYLNSHRCKADIARMTISDRSNLNQNSFEKLAVPVPPLEEQHRIISILDRFDALCNDLTSGLPAEIAARQKQYEYYRDELLTFNKEELF